MGRLRYLLITGLAGAALQACTPDFDDPWLVKDLRVLAVKATPPEVLALTEPPSDGATGDPSALLRRLDPAALEISLDVLAVDPRTPDREVDWEVWVCSADEAFCKDDSAFTERLKRERSRLDEISYRYRPTAEQLLASFEADALRGFGGLPLTVEFRLFDQERVVRAAKRLVYTFWLPYSPVPRCKRANRSPRLESVAAGAQGVLRESGASSISYGLDKEIVFYPRPSGERAKEQIASCPEPLQTTEPPPEVACEPDEPDESRETYWVVTNEAVLDSAAGSSFSQDSRQLCEFLSYSFFSSAGSFSHATTGGAPSPFVENKKITDPTSTWTAPTEALDKDVQFWVVVRDGRGGTDWFSFTGEGP